MTKIERFSDWCLTWVFTGVFTMAPLWFGIYHIILAREADIRKDLWPMIGHTMVSWLCLTGFCVFSKHIRKEERDGK